MIFSADTSSSMKCQPVFLFVLPGKLSLSESHVFMFYVSITQLTHYDTLWCCSDFCSPMRKCYVAWPYFSFLELCNPNNGYWVMMCHKHTECIEPLTNHVSLKIVFVFLWHLERCIDWVFPKDCVERIVIIDSDVRVYFMASNSQVLFNINLHSYQINIFTTQYYAASLSN